MATILDESFEGTGYENAWNETVYNNCTLDEDSAIPGTPPTGSGSQCLKAIVINSTYKKAYTKHVIANNDIWYLRGYLHLSEEGLVDTNRIDTLVTDNDSDNPVAQINIVDSGNNLYIQFQYYSNGTIQTTANIPFYLDIWYRVEYKYDITNSAWEWRIDGVTKHSGALSGTTRTPNRLRVGVTDYDGNGQSTLYTDLVGVDDTDWIGAESGVTFIPQIIMF